MILKRNCFHFQPVMEDWEFEILYQQLYVRLQIQDHIVDAIKCNSSFSVFNHIDHLLKLHLELNQDIEIQYQNLLNSVLQTFDDNKKRAIQRGIYGKTSAWLTVIPMAYHASF